MRQSKTKFLSSHKIMKWKGSFPSSPHHLGWENKRSRDRVCTKRRRRLEHDLVRFTTSYSFHLEDSCTLRTLLSLLVPTSIIKHPCYPCIVSFYVWYQMRVCMGRFIGGLWLLRDVGTKRRGQKEVVLSREFWEAPYTCHSSLGRQRGCISFSCTCSDIYKRS